MPSASSLDVPAIAGRSLAAKMKPPSRFWDKAFEWLTMAMALAELGRYDEAVKVQRDLMTGAERRGLHDVTQRLAENLALYERHQPCRMPWSERWSSNRVMPIREPTRGSTTVMMTSPVEVCARAEDESSRRPIPSGTIRATAHRTSVF